VPLSPMVMQEISLIPESHAGSVPWRHWLTPGSPPTWMGDVDLFYKRLVGLFTRFRPTIAVNCASSVVESDFLVD
jgi:hypothetical protein